MHWLDNKIFDRNLRKNGTPGERILWVEYFSKKNKEKRNVYRFLKQHRINKLNITVDFYCAKLRLCIEIDGVTHDSIIAQTKDIIRQSKIEELNYTVLRIYERDIYYNPQGVYKKLEEIINSLEKKYLCD